MSNNRDHLVGQLTSDGDDSDSDDDNDGDDCEDDDDADGGGAGSGYQADQCVWIKAGKSYCALKKTNFHDKRPQ